MLWKFSNKTEKLSLGKQAIVFIFYFFYLSCNDAVSVVNSQDFTDSCIVMIRFYSILRGHWIWKSYRYWEFICSSTRASYKSIQFYFYYEIRLWYLDLFTFLFLKLLSCSQVLIIQNRFLHYLLFFLFFFTIFRYF